MVLQGCLFVRATMTPSERSATPWKNYWARHEAGVAKGVHRVKKATCYREAGKEVVSIVPLAGSRIEVTVIHFTTVKIFSNKTFSLDSGA